MLSPSPSSSVKSATMDSEDRAERLLSQLQQWAMETVDLPRDQRQRFISEIALRYHEDALKNGLSPRQADAWRDSVTEWLHSLVDVIETSGGGSGGHA